MHPLDGVGIHVGCSHLDGGGQVQDDRVGRRRTQGFGDGVTYFLGVLELGAGVGLGRVFPAPVRVRVLLRLGEDQFGGVGGDLLDRVLVGAEHDAALQNRGGVVEVHDRVLGTFTGLERALDQLGTRLRQHLDGDVGRDGAVLDDLANEIEVRLARGREADLDLLVAHTNQEIEHTTLARRAHRIDQRLVAVAQVNGTPLGCSVDDLVRPGAVGQRDRLDLFGERAVAERRHRRVLLRVPRRLVGRCRLRGRGDGASAGGECVSGGHGCDLQDCGPGLLTCWSRP